MLKILSLGAGVQSSTVLMMSCLGELPKLDAAIFADTHWEPKAVYEHLAWLEVEAKKAGIPLYRVSAGNLREEAIDFRRTRQDSNGRWVSMPLYVKNPDGSRGIINRQCTEEYKIKPIEKFIKQELLGLSKGQRAKES